MNEHLQDNVLGREAVAVFTDPIALEDAIDSLLTHGFDRAELGVLASDDEIVARLGRPFASTRELECAPVPTAAYVERESVGDAEGVALGGFLYVGALVGASAAVAAGGGVAAAILGAALGGGITGVIGGVLAHRIGRARAQRIQERVREGGLLLWVRTRDEGRERKALAILEACGGEDVHAHGRPDGAAAPRRIDLEQALVDPAAVFASPREVLDAPLPRERKIEILSRWAYDARQLELAEEEGMRDLDDHLLCDVRAALLDLGAPASPA